MKKYVYLFGFVIVLLTLKAFYLDEYLEKQNSEQNTSISAKEESVRILPSEPIVEKIPKKEPLKVVPETNRTSKSKPSADGWRSHEKMPLDKLGDNIADKLKL